MQIGHKKIQIGGKRGGVRPFSFRCDRTPVSCEDKKEWCGKPDSARDKGFPVFIQISI